MKILDATKSRDPSFLMVKIPMVIAFDDYHEIAPFVDGLNAMKKASTSGRCNKIKAEEIGSNDNGYVAIFYYKKGDPEYKILVKEHGGNFTEEDN